MEPERRNILAGVILLSAGIVAVASSIWVYTDPEGYPLFIGAPVGLLLVALGVLWIVRGMTRKKRV